MNPTKKTAQRTSPVKIVIYFKRKKDGTPYTQDEINQSLNRKQEYKFCFFPKLGGGWVTNHEKGFDTADKHLRDVINSNNLYKGIIFLCKEDGTEERVVNYVDGKGWEFYHRPEFHTTLAGHRYISKYQSLDVFQKMRA